MPDVEGIAADEIAAERFDLGGDGAVPIVLAVCFTPADHAGIGLDADENEILPPPGMNRKTIHAGDFHGLLIPGKLGRRRTTQGDATAIARPDTVNSL